MQVPKPKLLMAQRALRFVTTSNEFSLCASPNHGPATKGMLPGGCPGWSVSYGSNKKQKVAVIAVFSMKGWIDSFRRSGTEADLGLQCHCHRGGMHRREGWQLGVGLSNRKPIKKCVACSTGGRPTLAILFLGQRITCALSRVWQSILAHKKPVSFFFRRVWHWGSLGT